MVYLLNKNFLPWCDFHKKFKDTSYEFKDFLRERLEIKYTKEVFRIIPKDLRDMFKKVFTLQFDEEPPYEYIINSIKAEIQKDIKLGPDLQPITHIFEWTHNVASKIKANIIMEQNSFNRSESKQLESLQSSKNLSVYSERQKANQNEDSRQFFVSEYIYSRSSAVSNKDGRNNNLSEQSMDSKDYY